MPPVPVPPPPVVPPPAPPSTTSQPNVTKNPAPESRELNNTLERLRAQQKQTQPPTARANQQHGGAPNAGGDPRGDVTATLTGAQMGAIGDKVRECWTKDAGALDIEKLSVQLIVTYDASGTARVADVGDADRGRMGDPRFRAFAERAVRAVLNERCATLPLPPPDSGKIGKLTFRFRP
jgi:hypothetical protein